MSAPWLGNWSSASQYSQTEVTGSMHGQTLQMHGFVGIAGLFRKQCQTTEHRNC